MDETKNNILAFKKPRPPKKEFKFTKVSVMKLINNPELSRGTRYYDYATTNLTIYENNTNRVYQTYAKPKNKRSAVAVTIGDITAISLADAYEIHQKNMGLIKQGLNPNEVNREQKEKPAIDLVKNYIRNQEENGTWSKKTIVLNKGLLSNHITPFLRNKSFAEISEISWNTWYNKLPTPAVGRNVIKLLENGYNSQRLKEKQGTESPKEIIKRLFGKGIFAQANKKDRALDVDYETHNLGLWFKAIEILRDGWMPDDEYIIEPYSKKTDYVSCMLFLLLTGNRISAVRNLDWKDINWDEEIISLKEKGSYGKKNETSVPLTDYLYVLLGQGKRNSRGKVFKISDKSLDVACTRVALLMSYWDKRPKFVERYVRDKTLISNKDYKKLCSEQARNPKFREQLNQLGTKPHSLRRTLENVGGVLKVSDSLLDTILDHSAKDTKARNYLTYEKRTLKDQYQQLQRYIDNRIAEYVGTNETAEQLESPIFGFLGEKVMINKDSFYQTAKQMFPEEKEFKIGD